MVSNSEEFGTDVKSWVPNWEKIVSVVTLTNLLQLIKENNTNYEVRNPLIIQAMAVASTLGYATGVRMETAEPEWPVMYIELPTGQVSWHIPQHTKGWDGHTTPEKYNRVDAYHTVVTQAVQDASVLDTL
jgi:hypothetical protein